MPNPFRVPPLLTSISPPATNPGCYISLLWAVRELQFSSGSDHFLSTEHFSCRYAVTIHILFIVSLDMVGSLLGEIVSFYLFHVIVNKLIWPLLGNKRVKEVCVWSLLPRTVGTMKTPGASLVHPVTVGVRLPGPLPMLLSVSFL